MTLLLVPLESEEAEGRLLDDLLESAGPNQRAIPVLARGGLLDQVQNLLRSHDLAFECVSADRAEAAKDTGHEARAPGLVVFSPGVDPALVKLARVLTGAPAIPLPSHEEEIARAIQGRRRSVLWLFDPDRTPPDASLTFATLAERQGLTWGFVFAVEPIPARFALLKSTLVDRPSASGRFHFTSGVYSIPGEEAPALTRIGAAPSSSGVSPGFSEKQDVLLMAGHANMLDAWIGREAIFCAREGYQGTGEDVASCFNGGRCYRQSPDGPSRELVAVGRAQANVIVLSGCNVLPLGQGWCRTEATLAYQIANSDTLAFMAPSVVSVGRFELDLLSLCLLLEGKPAGQVVREINRLRRDVLEQPTGLPAGLGPFVLMGNPELQLTGATLETAEFSDRSADAKEAYALQIPTPPTGRALIRVPMRARDQIPYPALTHLPEGMACRGLWHDSGARPALYLFTAGAPEAEGTTAQIEIREADEGATRRRTLEAWWDTLSFWAMFLYGAEQEMGRARSPSNELLALRDELPRLTGALSNYLGWRTPRGLLAEDLATRSEQDVLREALDAWSRRMLDALLELTLCVGRVSSAGNPPFLHPMRPLYESEPCTCGGRVLGQVFESPGATHTRVHRQCHLCGNSRDDDGASPVRWANPVNTVAAGETFQCRIVGRAPDDRFVHLHLGAILETWERDKRVLGSQQHAVFEPGAEIDLVLTLDVPKWLVPGVYPVGMIGVCNGSMISMRRSLPFRAPA